MTAELHLARAEGRRLLTNPFVWLALIPTVMWAHGAKGDPDESTDPYYLLVGYGLMLPGFVIAVVTILAVLRSRATGADGLLDTMPVGRDRRSVAHGYSVLAGAIVGGVLTLGLYVYFRPSTPILIRRLDTIPYILPVPRPNVAQLLQGPLAIAAVCAFVVALVRWVPTWLVAVPLFFLVFVQGLAAGIWDAIPTSPLSWLWPLATGVVQKGWTGCGEFESCMLRLSGYDQATPWWHLAYLLALGAWFVTIAVLRHRRDRAAWTAFAITLAAVVMFAVVQGVVYVQPTAV